MMDKLTRQEEQVMQAVWRLGRCTVREALAELGEPPMPYTTVASVMGNLKAKGYVSQQRQGNGYAYLPAIAENEYKRRFLAGFVHDYFRSSYKEMVTFFAREEQLSSDDLQDIIREIEKGG